MEFIFQNWYLIVISLAIGIVIGYKVYQFKKLPKDVKIDNVIKFLVWAVGRAEEKYGSGTGKYKLQEVYAMFIQYMPDLALTIPFETFSDWVDKALKEFNKIMLNDKIKNIINPDMVIKLPEEEITDTTDNTTNT